MPTYEYECSGCNHVFEEYNKIKDRKKPLKKPCPKCNEKKLQIKFGMTSIADPLNIGRQKPDKGFMEVLSKIKSVHKNHTMKDRW